MGTAGNEEGMAGNGEGTAGNEEGMAGNGEETDCLWSIFDLSLL